MPDGRREVVKQVYDRDVAHECSRHGVPCYHLSGCYAELKERLRSGAKLTAEELAFVGVSPVKSPEPGWRSASNLEGIGWTDDTLSASDRDLLQRLLGSSAIEPAGGWLAPVGPLARTVEVR